MPFSQLRLQFPLRRYQQLMLERVQAQMESEADDGRFHLVAPPGSGKTILGLELIRRFNAPAVVFAPTSVIQAQWREQFRHFCPRPELVDELCSLEADRATPLRLFTYQLLAVPAEAGSLLRAAARDLWLEELTEFGRAMDSTAAGERLEQLRANSPASFERDLAKYIRRLKRDILQQEPERIRHFLHPNALRLIQELKKTGVRTVVLDECHHLLDYWALVLRALVSELPEVRVIGLTGTAPDPATPHEALNYYGLLGDIDFEVLPPAVVREGELAPSREFALLVRPTAEEEDFLANIQQHFEQAIDRLVGSISFRIWLQQLLRQRDGLSWDEFYAEKPRLSLAALRVALSDVRFEPEGLELDELLPAEATSPPEILDWATLLEKWALGELKLSTEDQEKALFREVCQALLPFGWSLTERGLRAVRSPGDRILALSQSKWEGAARVLGAESDFLGDRLRALVLCDFENMGGRAGSGGGARRAFEILCLDVEAPQWSPVLVTGQSLAVHTASRDWLAAHAAEWARTKQLDFQLSWEPSEEHWTRAQWTGSDSSSRTRAAWATAALEAGVTRCLVGTRGLFGEGWDCRALNVLVDLTGVATKTAAAQSRGRAVRLDPEWPRKVAHHWDIVCLAPQWVGGEADLRRFIQRHEHLWSVAPGTAPAAILASAGHVDAEFVSSLEHGNWQQLDLEALNRRQLDEAADREKSWAMWAVGTPYQDIRRSVLRFDRQLPPLRTSFSIRNGLFRVAASGGLLAGSGTAAGILFLINPALAIVPLALAAGSGWLLQRQWEHGQGAAASEAILRRIFTAVHEALVETGQLTREDGGLRLVADAESFTVSLPEAEADSAALFAKACSEILAPISLATGRTPRYLIRYDPSPKTGWQRWLWEKQQSEEEIRQSPHFFPLPESLGTRRERAEVFARHWEAQIGGGGLVYTGSDLGREILRRERARRVISPRTMAFEVWS